MELLHLSYFQTIARLESLTQAADVLHVSQPSLSKILKRLETELGYPLFDRKGKRLRLNDGGRLFLSYVNRMFAELELGTKEFQAYAAQKAERLRIGAASSRLLPQTLTTYAARHRQGQFCIRQIIEPREMEEQLLGGRIDFCLSFHSLRHDQLYSVKLTDEDIFLAVSPRHPLARRPFVDLAEVKDEPFITLTSECGLYETSLAFCRDAGFIPTVAFEINSLEVIANLVSADLGVAFVPAFGSESLSQSITRLPIRTPTCRRGIWLSYKALWQPSPQQEQFRTFLLHYFSGPAPDSSVVY